ncbi:MAG: SCO family protein [Steroidobacteraceae bacterium]
MNQSSQVVVGAAVAIVAALAGMLLSRSLVQPAQKAPTLAVGTWLEPGRPLPEFTLVDQAGKPFDKARLQGRWNLLFFGFTSCPDICPTTLTTLGSVEQSLKDLPANDRPQVVFVSVDPQRDTPDRVDAYVRFFSPTIVGITGNAEAIASFADALHVPYAITPLPDGTYTVDHSSALFLVGPDGALRAVFSAPHDATKLATDFREVVSRAAAAR